MKNTKFFSLVVLAILQWLGATAQTITTVAGTPGSFGYYGDGGAATYCYLLSPEALCLDTMGNLYVADLGNYIVRKINTSGVIDLFAGTPGSWGYSGDGGPATAAELAGNIAGICVHSTWLYIADNQNAVIRRIDLTSGTISTFAGSGTYGYSGDGGAATAANMYYSQSICSDNYGNIYFSTDSVGFIRKVTASGIISAIAGNTTFGYSGDGGPATAASIGHVIGMCADNSGNVYLSDGDNFVIRKISSSGTISTFAGTGVMGYSGDGGAATSAKLNNAYFGHISSDSYGNVYLSDFGNDCIRKVDYSSGIITTFAGPGLTSSSAAGPMGIAVQSPGILYFSNPNDNLVKKVIGVSTLSEAAISGLLQIKFYPNPAAKEFTIEGARNCYVTISDIAGRVIIDTLLISDKEQMDISALERGIYLVEVFDRTTGVRVVRKVNKE